MESEVTSMLWYTKKKSSERFELFTTLYDTNSSVWILIGEAVMTSDDKMCKMVYGGEELVIHGSEKAKVVIEWAQGIKLRNERLKKLDAL
jgi:hypothetical protein